MSDGRVTARAEPFADESSSRRGATSTAIYALIRERKKRAHASREQRSTQWIEVQKKRLQKTQRYVTVISL
jgi:hypothetical protein